MQKFFMMAQMSESCELPAQTKAGTIAWCKLPDINGLKAFYFPETGNLWKPAVMRARKDETSDLAVPVHGRIGWLQVGDQSWRPYIFDLQANNWLTVDEYRGKKAEVKRLHRDHYERHPDQLCAKIRESRRRVGRGHCSLADVGMRR